MSKDSTLRGGITLHDKFASTRGVPSIEVVESTPSMTKTPTVDTKGGDKDNILFESRVLEEEVEKDIADF